MSTIGIGEGDQSFNILSEGRSILLPPLPQKKRQRPIHFFFDNLQWVLRDFGLKKVLKLCIFVSPTWAYLGVIFQWILFRLVKGVEGHMPLPHTQISKKEKKRKERKKRTEERKEERGKRRKNARKGKRREKRRKKRRENLTTPPFVREVVKREAGKYRGIQP